MKHLTTVFVFVLASATASKYFRPEHQLQQDSTIRVYPDAFPFTLEDVRFPSKPSEELTEKWEALPIVRMMVRPPINLDALESLLLDEPEEFRMKRMKASLSIDNPLDVLRHQYYKALARRMKFKSIEKNREHLIKTGKRSSVKESEHRSKLSNFPNQILGGPQKHCVENSGSEDSENYALATGSEQSLDRAEAAMSKRYKPHGLDDPSSYQT